MSKNICSVSVKEQLDSLRELEDGWYDGKQGVKLSEDGLNWLIDSWNQHCPSDIPAPFLYPWVDGRIHGEYSFGECEVILEFGLNEHTCSLLITDLSSNPVNDFDEERDFDFKLDDHLEWSKFFEKIRQCKKLYDI